MIATRRYVTSRSSGHAKIFTLSDHTGSDSGVAQLMLKDNNYIYNVIMNCNTRQSFRVYRGVSNIDLLTLIYHN